MKRRTTGAGVRDSRRGLARAVRSLALAGLAILAGPAAADEATGSTEMVLTAARAWTVDLIRHSQAADEMPALIVGLHGYAMDERQMRTLVDVRPAVAHVYVAVRGPARAEEGGHAWFPIALDSEELVFDPRDVKLAVNDVARLLPILAERYGADPDAIHVVGYSQGGTLALQMALARPEAAASFTGFAGAILPGTEDQAALASNPTPVLIGHGTRDPLITAAEIERTAALLRGRGRRVEVSVHAVPHVVSHAGREAIADFIERNSRQPEGRQR